MGKSLRMGALLLLLFAVVTRTLLDRATSRDWKDALWVAVFPVNADGSAATRRHLESLSRQDFAPIEEFFEREARRHGLRLARPLHVELRAVVDAQPPLLAAGSTAFATMLWSLRLRYYSWKRGSGSAADVRMFVLYHDPERFKIVPHSAGLQKGLVGVVYAYADEGMSGSNNVVIAHEIMHTLGAADRYDLSTGLPRFPDGYADRERSPRHPQALTEIMAGRRPVSEAQAEMPASLATVIVGPESAVEINWHAP
jgi:hypothetical protein